MKAYIKPILVILFLVFCIIFGFKYGIDMKYKNDMSEIYSSKSTVLETYNRNKLIAESYLKVYDIVDESSYQNIKNDLYNNLSYEMQQELFPTVNYSGLALHDLETEIIDIVGTNNSFDEKNTFYIEYRLKGVNYDKVITNLIYIEKGVITGVKRIN